MLYILSLFSLRNVSESWNGFGDSNVAGLAMAQDVVAFFIILCFGRFHTLIYTSRIGCWKDK